MQIKVSTNSSISGEELGMVYGNVVNSKAFYRDFIAGIKKFLGRELTEYTEMMDKARQTAVQRMVKQARDLGADAVVGVRFSTSMITEEAAEVMAYGTAIRKKVE